MNNKEADYKKLMDIINEHGNHDIELIDRAWQQCVQAHDGQMRKTHDEYYTHPFNVACIVASMGMDSESVAAALLHDVVEDTPIILKDIEKKFGKNVALLVDGVTKLGKLPLVTAEQQQSENLRKMLIAMTNDIRVIIIKLADRLHNMRTICGHSEQKQRDIALETIEVYAPIAHRLGMRQVKEELEDRSIQLLDPVAYKEIENLLENRQKFRKQVLDNISNRIYERLKEELPQAKITIENRIKSIHGIYRKMYIQGKNFEEIYDVSALRIITDTINNCYNILGIMHDMFRPIPGRFKDYISTPKPNMYQSLHTTVIGRDGVPFEIQIRTFDMHHTAEFGIAAHWKYKEGISGFDLRMEERLAWIRQILDSERDGENADSIVQSIKTDLATEDVFAVTPKGDVINLPVGATVIDFAFAIHSQVGLRMTGAKADGRIVPLNHQIQTGEIIDIITTSQITKGPSRDWLNIAVTNQAKSKIRNWFKKERRTENIAAGKANLERDFYRNGINLEPEEMQNFLEDIARRSRYDCVDDFYAAIGYGGILLSKIMPRIKESYTRIVKASRPAIIDEIVTPQKVTHSPDGVVVEGIDNCLIKLSKCCAPLPGDDIVGFITRGHGVSIHKTDCTNVPEDLNNCAEPERWIPAHWAMEQHAKFTSTLQISGMDRDGMLVDITTALYNMHIPIHAVNARQTKEGNCVITVTMTVESTGHLKSVVSHLKNLLGVFAVERTNS